MKRPAFQFYPADWLNDVGLQSCSIGARGLWVQLVCLMHSGFPYGHLTLAGKPMPDEKAANLARVPLPLFRKLLGELEDAGVSSRDDGGAIYSRRMVKDEAIRMVRAEAGKLGGNPNLLNQTDNQKSGSKVKCQPTPSSSSSSSSSKQGQKKRRAPKVALPLGFRISERVREWAAEKGHGDLEARFEDFIGYAKRSGAVYASWDDAFMDAVREDWAKLNRDRTRADRRQAVADNIFSNLGANDDDAIDGTAERIA